MSLLHRHVPLCSGVEPLSSRSLMLTIPFSISILRCVKSPVYAATCAGNAKSVQRQQYQSLNYNYRTQTKLRKVFTSVCQEFCPRGKVYTSLRADTPPRQTLPWADTPLGQTPHPSGRHSPGQEPLSADPPQQMATASDGMHPTGMHSFVQW